MTQSLRAIDQELFGGKQQKGFKSRNHGFTTKSIYEFALSLLGVMLGTTILVNLESLEGGLICLVSGVVLFIFAVQTQQSKLKLERSEFLNALFASAIADKYKFSAIVTAKDAQIAYMNYGFQQIFPEVIAMPKRTIAKLLAANNVTDAKKKSILEAIKKGTAKSFEIDVLVKAGAKKSTKQTLKISVEKIAKPEGFVLVRGQ